MRGSLNYVDLFAGCGGLSEGLEQTGRFRLLGAVEWNKAARNTLVARMRDKWGLRDADSRVLWYDIQQTGKLFSGWKKDAVYGSSEGLGSLVKPGPVHVVVGGPPCQAYSIAGRIRDSHGMRNDYRNYLFESYVQVVRRLRPACFVFENVEGMLSAQPGNVRIIDRIREAFAEIGYAISSDLRREAVFELADFGVPQFRKRVIIVGIAREVLPAAKAQIVLSEFYAEHRSRAVGRQTVKAAIGDLPARVPVSQGASSRRVGSHAGGGDVPNHEPRYHNSRDIEIFKELAADALAGSKKYPDIASLHRLYTKKTGKTSSVHKYFVLRWDAPSNAIVAHLHKDGLRHIHPDPKQARSITVREAARLQTFPDDFVFLGGQGDQFKMIGNAVPPLYAKALGQQVSELVSRLL